MPPAPAELSSTAKLRDSRARLSREERRNPGSGIMPVYRVLLEVENPERAAGLQTAQGGEQIEAS